MKRNILLLTVILLSGAFVNLPDKPRIFLIGDSTIAQKVPSVVPETGWGMMFQQYINLPVQNHAVNGRSTKSFRTLGHWGKVYEQLKPGDWVLIQFGHNDSKVSDTTRYADAKTDYRKNLVRYITEVRSKGAKPLLITPVMRRKFDEKGSFVDQHGDYPGVVKEVAAQLNVPLIDLHASSREAIVKLGVEDSKKLFLILPKGVSPNYPDGKDDNTHFSAYGASVMASLVAQGIRDLKIDLSQELTRSAFPDKYTYELPLVMDVSFRKDTFNITTYGARPDGITVNSDAIAKAIEACTQAGGGTVLIPKGLWLTGPIGIKSNVNLHISKDAVVQFSDNTADYTLIKTNWEGVDAIRCQSPIYATDAENIAITGGGILDGAGQAWRPVKKSKLTPPEWEQLVVSGGFLNEKKDTWYPTAGALQGSLAKRPGVVAEGYDLQKAEAIKEFLRPNMVSLTRCKRILLEGVTFQNSPAWCLHPLLSTHLTLRDLTVRNPWNAQNGDGVDIESCRYVKVENSTFDVGDDGICIKSGRDEEGRKRGVPTEDVIVRNCTVFHGHGGFVIGSEMSGGARNLYVSDCNFLGTDIGLRFKTARGRGGIVEKIYISNINMSNIGGAAILFDMYYMAKDPLAVFGGGEAPAVKMEPVTDATPQFRDFHVNNVTCKGAETAVFVRGLPEMNIKDIVIENIAMQSSKGIICQEGDNIIIRNATLLCNDKVVANVHESKNVTLDNLVFKTSDVVVRITGPGSKNIKLLRTDAKNAAREAEFGDKVSKNVFSKK